MLFIFTKSERSLVLAILLLVLLPDFSCTSSVDLSLLENRQDESHWVAAWTAMPQLVELIYLPPYPYRGYRTFRKSTIRQTVYLTIGVERVRFQISNLFGGSALPVTAASVAIPVGGLTGADDIDTSSLVGLTFNGGSPSVIIPKGHVVYTDPVDFEAPAQSAITLNLYLQNGQLGKSITGHSGSWSTTWFGKGNQLNASTVTGASTSHWYFVTAVEAWVPTSTSALVILGDSVTDGWGTSINTNQRWPDRLVARMQDSGIVDVAVANQAATGNKVIAGGHGPPLNLRYKRDLLQTAGVKYAVIFEGVNDIARGPADLVSQKAIGDKIILSFRRIAYDAHTAGIQVFAATVNPFGGTKFNNPSREATRQRVNNWIRSGGSGSFDAIIDFATVLESKANASYLAVPYDSGDHVHPDPLGYQAMADIFPLGAFNHIAATLNVSSSVDAPVASSPGNVTVGGSQGDATALTPPGNVTIDTSQGNLTVDTSQRGGTLSTPQGNVTLNVPRGNATTAGVKRDSRWFRWGQDKEK